MQILTKYCNLIFDMLKRNCTSNSLNHQYITFQSKRKNAMPMYENTKSNKNTKLKHKKMNKIINVHKEISKQHNTMRGCLDMFI